MSGFGSKLGSNGLFRYLIAIGKCYQINVLVP
jgi:hypothetical protein